MNLSIVLVLVRRRDGSHAVAVAARAAAAVAVAPAPRAVARESPHERRASATRANVVWMFGGWLPRARQRLPTSFVDARDVMTRDRASDAASASSSYSSYSSSSSRDAERRRRASSSSSSSSSVSFAVAAALAMLASSSSSVFMRCAHAATVDWPIEVIEHGTANELCRIMHTAGDISIGTKDKTKSLTFSGNSNVELKVKDDVYFDDKDTNPTLAGTIDRMQALHIAMSENKWDSSGSKFDDKLAAVESARATAQASLTTCYNDLATIYSRIDALKTKINKIKTGKFCSIPGSATDGGGNKFSYYDLLLWNGADWQCEDEKIAV